jgi:hypothetical protein
VVVGVAAWASGGTYSFSSDARPPPAVVVTGALERIPRMRNTAMNEFILARAGRKPRELGLMDRGLGRLSDDGRNDLQAAMVDYESAARAGDETGRDMADARIERLLEERRAAREPEKPAAAPVSGFDGGVRRPVKRSEPKGMNRVIAEGFAERQMLKQAARNSVA